VACGVYEVDDLSCGCLAAGGSFHGWFLGFVLPLALLVVGNMLSFWGRAVVFVCLHIYRVLMVASASFVSAGRFFLVACRGVLCGKGVLVFG